VEGAREHRTGYRQLKRLERKKKKKKKKKKKIRVLLFSDNSGELSEMPSLEIERIDIASICRNVGDIHQDRCHAEA
jgi:hypothetical protein